MNVSSTTATTSTPAVKVDSFRAIESKNSSEVKQPNTQKTNLDSTAPAVDHAAEKKVSDWIRSNTNLQFSIDEKSGQRIIKLVDSGTKEVIRQFPSEEMLRIAEAIDKFQESGTNDVKGLLLKQIA